MTHNAQSDSDFLRELATRKHFEYVASLESERDALLAALQEIAEIGATWREQLPGADEFFVGMFAIGRMRGVAEKALGIPLEDDTHE